MLPGEKARSPENRTAMRVSYKKSTWLWQVHYSINPSAASPFLNAVFIRPAGVAALHSSP